MKIGDEVYVHGYVDEIRKETVIIRNDSGYFGTGVAEVKSDIPTLADIIEVERERNYWHDLADSYERTILKLNTALQETEPMLKCKDCRMYEETNVKVGTCLLTNAGAFPEGYCFWAERKEE